MKERKQKKVAKGLAHHKSLLKDKAMPENKISIGWRIAIIAVIVVALIVIVWVVWSSLQQKPKPPVSNNVVGNQITQVPANQLPAVFPPNIPMEPNRQIVENYNASAANGQEQATRSFQSLQTVAANVSLYENFLADPKNGWTVLSSTTSNTADATLLAKNAGGILTIEISQLPPQPYPASLVDITYTTNP